jgi:Arc/MetJ-type ribon-helix-helix transcriptional regulator
MTIQLTPEHERIIEHVMRSGAYHDATEVISAALEALAEDLEDAAVTITREHAPNVSLEEVQAARREAAIEQLKTFGKTHGLSLGGLTLRQMREESRP